VSIKFIFSVHSDNTLRNAYAKLAKHIFNGFWYRRGHGGQRMARTR